MNLSRILRAVVSFMLICLGIVNPASAFDFVLGIGLALFVTWITLFGGYELLRRRVPQLLTFIIAPLVVVFVITSWINSAALRTYLAHEPIGETYRSDLDDFLKTYYLMERGTNYYTSFSKAVEQNAFKGYVAPNMWSWRLPTIFYIWKYLPGSSGLDIYYLFILSAGLALWLAHKIFLVMVPEQFHKYSLLSAYLMYPYLHYGARDTVMLHTEWWTLVPLFGGLYLLQRKRIAMAAVAFTFAVLIRELFIIPLVLSSTLMFIFRQPRWKVVLLPVVVLSLILVVHYFGVRANAISDTGLTTPRIHTGFGKSILLGSLAYGSWEYHFYKYRLFAIFYVVSITGLLLKFRQEHLPLWGFILFPLAFFLIGSSVYNDYWGVFYIPFVLFVTPLIVTKL
jgi:hypothetical protein